MEAPEYITEQELQAEVKKLNREFKNGWLTWKAYRGRKAALLAGLKAHQEKELRTAAERWRAERDREEQQQALF